MLETITEDELELLEGLEDPICATEIIFSDLDNFLLEDEDKFAEVRKAQIPMLSFEYLLDYDESLVPGKKPIERDKANFQLRVGAGSIECFGGRKFGKTHIVEKVDLFLSFIHLDGEEVIFTSMDLLHIKTILESIIRVLENHTLFRMFKANIRRAPDYEISLINGYILYGINMKLQCFDDKTEILTNNGWRTLNTINKDDKALSLNPSTDIADYYDIKNIFINDYSGEIFRTNGFSDFIFTPEHELYYNWSFSQNWRKKKISEFDFTKNSQLLFKHKFKWNSTEKFKNIVFNIRNNNKKFSKVTINSRDWLEFLGWYISEGWLDVKRNRIFISQYESVNKEKVERIRTLLIRLGVTFNYNNNKFSFYNKEIANYLKENCYTGTEYNCHYKKVPETLKNISSEEISIFLESYRLGDGHRRNEQSSYYTTSKQLADDIQELILKTGKPTSYYINDNGCYCIYELKSETRNIPLKNITKEQYHGKVWCIEVEPHNIILIRRNGKICWTGNSKEPGSGFYQKHVKRIYIEEASFETEEVYKKRIEAISELGCVVRAAGMTNFTKYMPAGRRFYDLATRARICNLPQYCNSLWGPAEKEKAIREHGGENSISYRIFVKGEVVEDAVSVFDMERVRKNYIEDKFVKNFEVTKENFLSFRSFLILDRPKAVEQVIIDADIGESAPTEIIIFFKLDEKYRYVYNITCYNLTDKQQTEIFRFLIDKLEANLCGLDTTDGTGRAIYRRLEEIYDKSNLVFCSFNEKLPVDFEKDENDNVVIDNNGKPVHREEYVSEWSVKFLKDLLYEQRIDLPLDYKLDKQLNSVIAMQNSSRTVYKVVGDEDHLFSAFRVFAISIWLHEFSKLKSMKSKKIFKGVI